MQRLDPSLQRIQTTANHKLTMFSFLILLFSPLTRAALIRPTTLALVLVLALALALALTLALALALAQAQAQAQEQALNARRSTTIAWIQKSAALEIARHLEVENSLVANLTTTSKEELEAARTMATMVTTRKIKLLHQVIIMQAISLLLMNGFGLW